VADVHAEEGAQPVEVAVAVLVPDVAAVTAHDDRHLVVGAERAHAAEVHPQVPLSELLQRRPLLRRRHRASVFSTLE
jgi:hypothetical protein